MKRGSPGRANAQRGATARNPVTRPVWPPGRPQNLRNSAFFAFRKGFCKCPDRDVGHDSANTPEMGAKQCVLQHFKHIFTPRMPRIYNGLQGFVAYFRFWSERAQYSPVLSRVSRSLLPNTPGVDTARVPGLRKLYPPKTDIHRDPGGRTAYIKMSPSPEHSWEPSLNY